MKFLQGKPKREDKYKDMLNFYSKFKYIPAAIPMNFRTKLNENIGNRDLGFKQKNEKNEKLKDGPILLDKFLNSEDYF